MFYIDTRIVRKREILLLHVLPTVIVFLAFLGATYLSWNTARRDIHDEQYKVLLQQNNNTAERITRRMAAYEDILRGGVGLFQASDDVTRSEWQQYFTAYDIASRYPGIHGVGYITLLSSEEKTQHETSVQSQGIANYKIFPEGSRTIYSSIVYIEPMSTSNRQVLGYDMYSEPVRRAAMDRAITSGKPALSDVVSLIQENMETNKQPGFLMYTPIYKTASIPDSVEERTANIKGFVYAPFRAFDLFNQTLAGQLSHYEFTIENHADSGSQLVYSSKGYEALKAQKGIESQTQTITFADKTWEITGITARDVVNEGTLERPSTTLWGGALFSIVLASLLYILLGNRAHVLARKEEQSIQEAKDELLALASHQLRTPATGVKQYIGIVREGLAGKLTPHQQELIDKAYNSNERQLHTINEMLVVARADAGHLLMNRRSIALNELTQSIADEYQSAITERKQSLRLHIPKRKIIIQADQQYLRMAIENILSNASKYTKSGGHIEMKLSTGKTRVTLKIRDTGVGVAPENYRLLFKKFSRIPNELTDKVVGSGIGLYLAKRIIEAHHGKINFISSIDKGSTVTMILPKNTSSKKKKLSRKSKAP